MDSHKTSPYDLIANLYIVGQHFRNAELNPRYYGTDIQMLPNEAYTLRIIAENPGIIQKDITAKTRRTKGATSIIVKSLLQKELVYIRNELLDQRKGNLYVTPKGEEIYRTHLDYDKRYLELFSQQIGISEEELANFNNTLVRFLEYVQMRKENQANDFT